MIIMHRSYHVNETFLSMQLQMNNLDPSLKKLFDTVGISDHQLKDKETAKFIYDFIDQHGGIEALKREQQFPTPAPQCK